MSSKPDAGEHISSHRTFPPELRSVRDARQFVRSTLVAVGLEADAAELVTSELVGNVVEHARTPVRLAVHLGAVIRIEVSDGNSIVPALRDAAEDAERGRGLLLIEAHSRGWGVEMSPSGKTIWVEVDAAPRAYGRAAQSGGAGVQRRLTRQQDTGGKQDMEGSVA